MASARYISIEEAAQRLNLHVRTVRRYVRSGRLKAVRVGKQYRIAPEDLDALVGATTAAALPTDHVSQRRHTEIVGLVWIDVIDPEEGERVASAVKGYGKGWLNLTNPVHVESLYDKDRRRLKLVLAGSLSEVGDVLTMVDILATRRAR
jgi:excisionase family DNA binding protein